MSARLSKLVHAKTFHHFIVGVILLAGVHLFGGHDPAHFGSLGVALFSLLRVITLDNWAEICGAAQGAAPLLAMLYFVSFILLGTMIMLNLFIGVVMNSMSEMHAETEARERAQHLRESGCTTLADEIHVFERQIEELNLPLSFPNMLITAHQAFLTREPLGEIARVRVENLWRAGTGDSLAGTLLAAPRADEGSPLRPTKAAASVTANNPDATTH